MTQAIEVCVSKCEAIGWQRAAAQARLRRTLRPEFGRARFSFSEIPSRVRKAPARGHRLAGRLPETHSGDRRGHSARPFAGLRLQAQERIADTSGSDAHGSALFYRADRGLLAGRGRLD